METTSDVEDSVRNLLTGRGVLSTASKRTRAPIIASALDDDNYVVMASLDLVDIFDVKLLMKRLKIIGLTHDPNFGDSGSCIKLKLSIRSQIFFSKCKSIQ